MSVKFRSLNRAIKRGQLTPKVNTLTGNIDLFRVANSSSNSKVLYTSLRLKN